MHKRLILISILNLSLFLGLAVVMGQSETPQSTEELPPLVLSSTAELLPPRYYPEYLICEEVEAGEGASWLDIEIGVSSLNDLLMTLSELGEYEVWLVEDAYIYLGRIENEDEQPANNLILMPSYVAVCVSEDNIVISLGILSSSILSHSEFQPDIYDFVAWYGRPDMVSWTVRPLDRIAFWFESGIAASIYVGPETEYADSIHEIYYYPFIDETKYEDEYPFAYTREEQLSSIEQNPFDFDAIVATVGVQPSRTPTPTLDPRSTETAIP